MTRKGEILLKMINAGKRFEEVLDEHLNEVDDLLLRMLDGRIAQAEDDKEVASHSDDASCPYLLSTPPNTKFLVKPRPLLPPRVNCFVVSEGSMSQNHCSLSSCCCQTACALNSWGCSAHPRLGHSFHAKWGWESAITACLCPFFQPADVVRGLTFLFDRLAMEKERQDAPDEMRLLDACLDLMIPDVSAWLVSPGWGTPFQFISDEILRTCMRTWTRATWLSGAWRSCRCLKRLLHYQAAMAGMWVACSIGGVASSEPEGCCHAEELCCVALR